MAKGKTRSANVHENRDNDTRDEVHEEEDTPWIRGASLDVPEALKAIFRSRGHDWRWIAFRVNGQDTPTNLMRKRREGWEPVKAEGIDVHVPTMDHGPMAGCIVVEGSILCSRPMAISNRRTKHFRALTMRRTDAINADLERTNSQNRNPAFGPISMATKAMNVREVPMQQDTE